MSRIVHHPARLLIAVLVAFAFALGFLVPPPSAEAAPAKRIADTVTTRTANVQPDFNSSGKLITLDSGYMRGVYCELADEGFNGVTLTWAIGMTSTTSGKIVARKAGPGTAPTPTDAEIRRAIRSAKTCGISKVILKPHLWLPGNEWRAHIVGNKATQAGWTRYLKGIQKIALTERAYEVVITTEQRDMTTTSGDTTRWLSTIKTLRKADPKKTVRLTGAFHNPDELLVISPKLAKALDGVYSTYYPRPKSMKASDLTEAALYADMKTDASHFAKAKARYGSKWQGFAESGFRSIDPRDYYDWQGTTPRVDNGLQARQYAAFLRFIVDLKTPTLMLYRAQAGGTDPAGFAWHDKPAESVIREQFVR